ncbi:hypothetical protein [Rhodopirellula bahusiensis]|uniref:hypothetical protein n=1 Tax=Rhodopirellula bahusiensis TaxID=2014065 RepID=UPI003267AD62
MSPNNADAAATIPTRAKMLGDLLSGHFRLNEKLFYGSNLPAITPKGEQYSPEWSDTDIFKLKFVFNGGAEMFRHLLPSQDDG